MYTFDSDEYIAPATLFAGVVVDVREREGQVARLRFDRSPDVLGVVVLEGASIKCERRLESVDGAPVSGFCKKLFNERGMAARGWAVNVDAP
jgi:hypothetical protein